MRDYKELYREAKGDLPRIYVDMDGVLCDFIAQSKKATGKIFTQDKAKEYWPIIKRTPRFWSDMPWMPGGKQLWNYIKQYNPHILSAYTPDDPNCIPGKRTWLRKNVRISSNRVNLVRRVEKQKLENEKNKVVKPEPNPETGEVPLRTGLANAILDKKGDSTELLKKVEKKKEIKMSGQSKIEINPKADIGQYSGGNQVNTGNLH